MSHLSKIRTRITNTKILKQTLNDLGFSYECKQEKYPHILVKDSYTNNFEFNWDGQKYELIADLELWNKHINIESILDQITQQYSYNSIIKTSIKEGFNNISKDIMKDGSIKLIIQRWN